METIFSITQDEFMQVYRPAALEFMTPARTSTLAEAVVCAVGTGDTRAAAIPAADFLVRVALNVCRSVTMPAEIYHRAHAAAFISHLALLHSLDDDLFTAAYRASSSLSLLGTAIDIGCRLRDVFNEERMASISETPFLQVACVTGGALRALQLGGIRQNEAAIIRRSESHRQIGTITAHAEDTVYNGLGRPYATVDCFALPDDPQTGTIDFDSGTAKFIGRYNRFASGCSARNVDLGNGGTLFHMRYGGMQSLMLTDGAKATGVAEQQPGVSFDEESETYLLTVDSSGSGR